MKQRAGWTMIAFLMLGLISCARQTADLTLKQGRELEKQGQYFEAQAHYQKMPDPVARADFQHNLEHLYGDIIAALRAQRQNPESAETSYALGRAYYNKASSLPAGTSVEPNLGLDLDHYFAEQRAQFQAEALSALDNAIEFSRSYAALPSGQLQIQVERAPAPSKEYQHTLLLQGKLYEEMGQPQKAIDLYQQVASLQPTSSEPLYRLGLLVYNQGDPFQGITYAEQAVLKYPGDANAHFALGILYARETRTEEAIKEFHQTLCLNAYHSDAYYKLGQIFLDQGNITDAERILRLGALTIPDNMRLNLFYQSIRATVDQKEKDAFIRIYQEMTGEVATSVDINTVDPTKFEASPALQIRYLRLLQSFLQRDQPYLLPCSGETVHPFFTAQMAKIENQIETITQNMASSEAAGTPAPPQ